MPSMLGCFSCLAWFWRTDRSGNVDSERQPLFPPPETVITRPPALAHLPRYGSNEHSSSSSSPQLSPPPTATRSHGWSIASERRRERIGSISRAAQGCMRPLAQPGSRSSSGAPTPLPTRISFFEPPHRRAAPNLGRSVSEPRSLTGLASHSASVSPKPDFAPHQIPPATPSGLRGRPRSATALDRLSSLHSSRHPSSADLRHITGALSDGDRGRSPGPSRLGRSSSAGVMSDLARVQMSEVSETPSKGVDGQQVTSAHTEDPMAGEGARICEPAVTQLELGLRDLIGQGTLKRSKRGRTCRPRGRATG